MIIDADSPENNTKGNFNGNDVIFGIVGQNSIQSGFL